tara:strand:+ start:8560 stop:8751 length:192 start_codon:yes stop_codon:yes gene_type:complete
MVAENKSEYNMVDKIIRYENGEMNESETVEFFQELIDSGLAWKLQGHYGRVATSLIEEGLCSR